MPYRVKEKKYRSAKERFSSRTSTSRRKRQMVQAAWREAMDVGPGSLANLAVRGLQLAPGELKSKDQSLAGFGVDFNGTGYLLNGIARGDDIDERIGRQVTCKAYEVNLAIRPAVAGAAPVPSIVRCMIVYDKQTNGAIMTPSQLLLAIGTANAPLMPRSLENRERFTVLRDMKIGMASAELTDYQPAPKVVKIYQSVVLPMTFNAGDAGTVADITTGALYAIFISDQAGAPLPVVSFTSRVRYMDN